MIISASRRTDIPAFYSEWFINRLKAGYVLVRNPFNTNQISKVFLNPDQVDCIVFWTKNPFPMIKKLHKIDQLGFKYYFQFTLTAYDQSIEKNLPEKKSIINVFQELSEKIGSQKVIWRYDPILLTDKYSVDSHEKWFRYLSENLSGYTEKCVISFINMYKKCEKNLKNIAIETISNDKKKQMADQLSKAAGDFGISIESCAEDFLLSKVGVNPGKCIDDRLISKIVGDQLVIGKDKTQRHECRCVTSIDIGAYNTCRHGCRYCYANYSEKAVNNNCKTHDMWSPLLVGHLSGDEKINVREIKSFRPVQNLFSSNYS